MHREYKQAFLLEGVDKENHIQREPVERKGALSFQKIAFQNAHLSLSPCLGSFLNQALLPSRNTSVRVFSFMFPDNGLLKDGGAWR